MPRYFFHFHDGKNIPDHKGAELSDWNAARLNAIALVGRTLADEPERIVLGEDWRMEVTDALGRILFRLDFHVTAAPAVHADRASRQALP